MKNYYNLYKTFYDFIYDWNGFIEQLKPVKKSQKRNEWYDLKF